MTTPPRQDALKFTIIIPTFRRENWLAALFADLADQVGRVTAPVEVLLIDNSPEGSAAGVGRPDFVRYIHEDRPGVSNARNRGVAEASGTHVIFLDDDERPGADWLPAFERAARSGHRAYFGAIEPRFETQPPERLFHSLDRLFSRRIPATDGADVAAFRAYLGSGNSMFARDLLLTFDPPFDTRLHLGGEDVWLFRQLVEDHGVALIWCPAALVHEIVPANRANSRFLRQRRFSDGQLRCLIESGAGGLRGALRVGLWMGVGLIQATAFGLGAIAARPVSHPLATRWAMTASGGMGKLLWWRKYQNTI